MNICTDEVPDGMSLSAVVEEDGSLPRIDMTLFAEGDWYEEDAGWDPYLSFSGDGIVNEAEEPYTQDGQTVIAVRSHLAVRDDDNAYALEWFYIDPESGELTAAESEQRTKNEYGADVCYERLRYTFAYDRPYEPEKDLYRLMLEDEGPRCGVTVVWDMGSEREHTQYFDVPRESIVYLSGGGECRLYLDTAMTQQCPSREVEGMYSGRVTVYAVSGDAE